MGAGTVASWIFLSPDADVLNFINPRTGVHSTPISVVKNIESMKIAVYGFNNATETRWDQDLCSSACDLRSAADVSGS